MKPIHCSLLFIIAITISACGDKSKQKPTDADISDSSGHEEYKPAINLPPPNEKESHVKYSKVIWLAGRKNTAGTGWLNRYEVCKRN